MKPSTLEWIKKAESDYQLALTLARRRKTLVRDQACFMFQQSAEKYLKARLEEANLPVSQDASTSGPRHTDAAGGTAVVRPFCCSGAVERVCRDISVSRLRSQCHADADGHAGCEGDTQGSAAGAGLVIAYGVEPADFPPRLKRASRRDEREKPRPRRPSWLWRYESFSRSIRGGTLVNFLHPEVVSRAA